MRLQGKLLSLNLFAGLLLVNQPLHAAEVSTNKQTSNGQLSAQDASELAATYQALAKYYQALAEELNQKDITTANIQSDAPLVVSKQSEQSMNATNEPKESKEKSSGSKETLGQLDKKQEKSPWNGTNATLGFQYNTGNTFQRNLSASTNVSYKADKNWLHTLSMNYQNAFDYNKDATTANKFFASGQSEYDFSQYNGVYLNIQYLNDQLSGYVYQINENVGYKRRLYKNNGMTLDLFFGPGMQQTRQTQETGGAFYNEPSVQVKTQYKWQINDKTSYSQMVQWIKTPRHYTVGLTMALTTSLYNSFGLQPSFTLNYDSNPPINSSGNQLKKLDTTTQLSFVYNF
ncbi:DUF481 domain-containing protein [Thiotrichales bacterium 19S3-7]|nr:DUF481 domain-containing protein [Thiotrichales bacterium 19S3-7]MCF6801153.1 DUF481 domain-containing protein [Thiotrichales bacterium 19S3-11]